MSTPPQRIEHLACLRVGGAERESFLQGQLSSDLAALGANRAGLTSFNNRQGRAICTAVTVACDDAILLVLPTDQIEETLRRLRMYVLRAKVELDRPGFEFSAYWSDEPGAWPAADWSVGPLAGNGQIIRMPGTEPRWLALDHPGTTADDGRWRYEDVRAGLPQVYPATREAFLPQALNLDALDAISFEKGCYVGQEIIARLHFRGTVKRRMRLFEAAGGLDLPAPGDAILRGEKSVGKIVDAAARNDVAALLAVCPVDLDPGACTLEDGRHLTPVPLPYSLPSA